MIDRILLMYGCIHFNIIPSLIKPLTMLMYVKRNAVNLIFDTFVNKQLLNCL